MTDLPRPPAHIALLTDLIGVDKTLGMGGAELVIPARPTRRSRLVRTIGIDAATVLSRNAGRLPRQCPLGKPWVARTLHSRGLPAAEIARRLHVTEATVWRYLGLSPSRRPDPRQLPLI